MLIKIRNRFTVKVGDAQISMKIKRLRYGEAGPVLMTILRALTARAEMKEDATNADRITSTEAFLAALDVAIVKEAFEKYVSDVEGLETEDGPVTTGIGLYEVIDVARVLEVLGELRRLADLTAQEAGFLGSPFTFSSTQPPSPSVSAVTSTSNAAGTLPITAPETQDESAPSIGPV